MSGRLHPDDVEAIARRVAELLREEPARPARAEGHLLTAAEVAERFGVTRDWVYAHRDRLGALRLGGGTKPRLRFDAERVAEAVTSRSDDTRSPAADAQRRRAVWPPAGGRTPSGSPLLPIPGDS